MTSTTARAQERIERFTRTVDGAADQWNAQTPCKEWTVTDVIRHAIGSERDFLVAQGLMAQEPAPETDDPGTDWHLHRAALLELLGRAGVPETEYDGYFGRTTIADTLADFYGWDLVVHSWDIARATAQDWSISDEEAAALGRTADGWGDALYAEGIMSPAVDVPADASAQDRLLGRLGRDPHWTP